MTDFITAVRTALPNFKNAIVTSVDVSEHSKTAVIHVVTDTAYTQEDEQMLKSLAGDYVPDLFSAQVDIVKLTPDCQMVERKIREYIAERYKFVSATMTEGDIAVRKTYDGFIFTLTLMGTSGMDMAQNVADYLKKNFCGNFVGECVKSTRSASDIEVEEEHENIEYIVPLRTFPIENFVRIEGTQTPTTAVYMADVNFVSESVVMCGEIQSITERTFKRKTTGQEKPYFALVLNDGTASFRATYFPRQKSYESIRALKEGDWIVCSGKTEVFNGDVRFTVNYIDYGRQPNGFVPEKRKGKPTPKYYITVKPQPFVDQTQADMFADTSVPECLMGKDIVVFDLETTGLNSSPSAGNVDKIIEVGAFKIKDGVIKESFTTFIDPQHHLSDETTALTGITDDMVRGAPLWDKVMPDFYKFCDGCTLVGHNIAGFDFKFVDYYCSQCGYMLERKLYDTLTMAQQQLFLANYKLNTVADYFHFTFNHHRAIDDALVTAKVFLELVKLKKSLPNLV